MSRILYSLVLPLEPAVARAFAAGLAAVGDAVAEESRTGEANDAATAREVDRTIERVHELLDRTLGQYGFVAHGEWTDDELFRLEETAKGHRLVVHAVSAARTDGAVAYVTLPPGASLDPTGDTLPDPEPEYVSVAGDDLPRPARALVTAWWEEVQAAGEVQFPAVECDDLRPTRGGGLFSLLGPALYPLATALEYATRLERAALDLRDRVEQARADDGTRDADYADALDRLAVVERAEGKYDTDTTDHAVTRAADAIRTGRARMTSASDAGLEGEGWAITTKPAPEPDGE